MNITRFGNSCYKKSLRKVISDLQILMIFAAQGHVEKHDAVRQAV